MMIHVVLNYTNNYLTLNHTGTINSLLLSRWPVYFGCTVFFILKLGMLNRFCKIEDPRFLKSITDFVEEGKNNLVSAGDIFGWLLI